jgi:hypothetical protein
VELLRGAAGCSPSQPRGQSPPPATSASACLPDGRDSADCRGAESARLPDGRDTATTAPRGVTSARLPACNHSRSRSPSAGRSQLSTASAPPGGGMSEQQLLRNLGTASRQAKDAAACMEAEIGKQLAELKESLARAAVASSASSQSNVRMSARPLAPHQPLACTRATLQCTSMPVYSCHTSGICDASGTARVCA